VVELLDLLEEHFKLFRAERAALQEFHWHGLITRRARRLVLCSPGHVVSSFIPVRYRGRAEVTAAPAAHTGPERRHRNIIRPGVDVDLGVVAAGAAGDEQPADTPRDFPPLRRPLGFMSFTDAGSQREHI
jgi:hypothetical protein